MINKSIGRPASSFFTKDRLFPIISLLAISGLILEVILLLFRVSVVPLIHDTALFHFIAAQILSGKVPYRDIYDMNLPGIYWIHMYILAVFGKSDAGWTASIDLWLILTAFAASWYCWRVSRLSAFLAAPLVISLVYLLSVTSYGQRDFFLPLFILIALHLLASELEADAVTSKQSFLHLCGSGIALGAASTLKPTPVFLLFLFAAFIFIKDRKGNSTQFKRQMLWLGCGFVTIPAILGVWLSCSGGLAALIEIGANFLPIYTNLHAVETSQLFYLLGQFSWRFFITCPILFVGMLFYPIRKVHLRVWLMGLTTAFGGFHYLIQGKGWDYHSIPFLMFGLIFEALLFGVLLQGKIIFQAVGLLWNLLTIAAFTALISFVQPYPSQPLTVLRPVVPALVSDLQHEGMTPKDRIQIMDAANGGLHALFLLNHSQATRYIYDFLLVGAPDEPYIQKIQKEMMQDLHHQPPTWIVIFTKGWGVSEKGLDRFAKFPSLVHFLQEYYSIQIARPDYTIYHYRQ